LKDKYKILINATFENDAIRLVTHRDVNRMDLEYLRDCLDEILNNKEI